MGKIDWAVPKINMLTNNNVLQHILYETKPISARTAKIMKLIMASFIAWYSAIEDEEYPVLHIFTRYFIDFLNSILIGLYVRLGLKKYVHR